MRHEQITRRGHTYEAVFFTSESITGIKLSAVCQFVVVKEQGPQEGLWDTPASNPPACGASPARGVWGLPSASPLPSTMRSSIPAEVAPKLLQWFAIKGLMSTTTTNQSPYAPLPVGNGLYKGQTWGLGCKLLGKVICLPDPKLQEYPVLPGKPIFTVFFTG